MPKRHAALVALLPAGALAAAAIAGPPPHRVVAAGMGAETHSHVAVDVRAGSDGVPRGRFSFTAAGTVVARSRQRSTAITCLVVRGATTTMAGPVAENDRGNVGAKVTLVDRGPGGRDTIGSTPLFAAPTAATCDTPETAVTEILTRGGAGVDAPVLSALRVTRGAVRFRLSGPGTVRFTVTRGTGTRRAGTFAARVAGAGTRVRRVPRRLGGRALAVGRYRLTAVAEAGDRSDAPRTATFRVARRS